MYFVMHWNQQRRVFQGTWEQCTDFLKDHNYDPDLALVDMSNRKTLD